ncbi:Membrane-associated progesterone-binding protein 4 [Bienertia sinuspersici]
MGRSTFVGIAVAVAFSSLAFRFFLKPHQNHQPSRLFTAQELALYNGTDEQLPIFLGILGLKSDSVVEKLTLLYSILFHHSLIRSIFDVTKGKSHYGVGGAYNHFAGRDASRAFVSGNFTALAECFDAISIIAVLRQYWQKLLYYFGSKLANSCILIKFLQSPLNAGDGLTDTLRGLSSSEVKSVVEWRGFFSRTYIFVGKLVGRYYDYEGKPTKHLKAAEAKAARGVQLLEKQKHEEEKIPNCNSKWSQDEGGEVWCDDGYPRLMQRPLEIALTGKMSKRCVCIREEDLEQPGLQVYEGCSYYAQACKV